MGDNQADRPRSSPQTPGPFRGAKTLNSRVMKCSFFLCVKAICVSCSITNLSNLRHKLHFRHVNLVRYFKLYCFEVILVFCFLNERVDRNCQKRSKLISWYWRWGAVSLWNTGHKSLAVRCGGAKAEGPVFSLTLSPLMTNTGVFTEVDRSFLVMAVDTGCYWAHMQLRADTDVLFSEFWQGRTAGF